MTPETRRRWRASSARQKQVPSIFEVGALAEAAKAEFGHGNWLIMIKDELPFGPRVQHVHLPTEARSRSDRGS